MNNDQLNALLDAIPTGTTITATFDLDPGAETPRVSAVTGEAVVPGNGSPALGIHVAPDSAAIIVRGVFGTLARGLVAVSIEASVTGAAS